MNKLTFLQSIMLSTPFDLFCVTETWLTDQIYDNEIHPHNYTIYRRDRHSRGGGVAIIVSNQIPSRLISSHDSVKMITIELSLVPKLMLTCVYVPPSSSDRYLNDLISAISSLPVNCNSVITGDFNSPDINWASLPPLPTNMAIYWTLFLLYRLTVYSLVLLTLLGVLQCQTFICFYCYSVQIPPTTQSRYFTISLHTVQQ